MRGSIITIDSGRKLPKVKSISANYTIQLEDRIVGIDTSGGPITVIIPSTFVSSSNDNYSQVCIFKDESGDAAINNITIVTQGSETIDESATKVINTNFGSVGIYSDGSNLFTL